MKTTLSVLVLFLGVVVLAGCASCKKCQPCANQAASTEVAPAAAVAAPVAEEPATERIPLAVKK